MKLNWLRAGCASIAEVSDHTCAVFPGYEQGTWCGRVVAPGKTTAVFSSDDNDKPLSTREDAEAACEAWLDQFDKPVWTDATPWLSYAEWRGGKIIVRPPHGSSVCWEWQVNGAINADWGRAVTISEAKAAAEKYVREQTGGAA